MDQTDLDNRKRRTECVGEEDNTMRPFQVTQVDIRPTTTETEQERNNETTAYVNRKTYRPINIMMNMFGVSSDLITVDGKDYTSRSNKIRQTLLKIYGCAIVIILTVNMARMIPGIVMGKFDYHMHFKIAITVWYTRCLFQAIFLVRICWPASKSAPSKLIKLVQDLDDEINDPSVMTQCKDAQNTVRSFKRYTKTVFWAILVIIVMNSLFILLGMFIAALSIQSIMANVAYPFQTSVAVKLGCFVLQTFLSMIWMLPVTLYMTMSQSLVYALGIFEAKVKSLDSRLSLPGRIAEIRLTYLKIIRLAEEADEIFGPLALIVYFFDIVQFSFTLYIAIYSAHSTMEKFLVLFWASTALMCLFLLSISASSVVEKGKSASSFLQKINTTDANAESNAELSLLLFHLSGDPIVMTIWKLIPLYKSIIVSVSNIEFTPPVIP
eukprot:gene10770-11923_t